jgi:methionyl-tRNA formyltransferase
MSSENRKARVLLIGYGPTTGSALEALADEFDVVGLVRDVDDDVTSAAAARQVPVLSVGGHPDIAGLVDSLRPDCTVVSSFNRILPEDLLERCAFVNVHYAPLPRYRGRANVNWAIINRENEAAVTVHSMVGGLDAGGVLAQEVVPVRPRDTVRSLYERLNDVQRRILPSAVRRRLRGEQGESQAEESATYGCTRVPDDGEIDWRAGTEEIDALVRALSEPYPGALTFLGLRRLWVLEAEPSPDPRVFVGRVPGRVVGYSRERGWADVLTGDGTLRVHRIRYDGSGDVPASTVLRSTSQTLGLRSGDLADLFSLLRGHGEGVGQTSSGRSMSTPAHG